MKTIGRKAVRPNVWAACAVILAVGASGRVLLALPQTTHTGAEDSRTATRAEVPFKMYRDYAIVVRGSVGERDKLNFLIDTGSSSTVVDASLAKKNGLPTSSRAISVFEGTVAVEEAVLPSLQLGPLQVVRLPAVVQDLASLADIFSVRVDAIVGIDVLSRSSFTVDYQRRKLIWGPAERLPNAVSCDPRFPYPTMPLLIGNRTLNVYLDTGAQELALFENRTGPVAGMQVVHEETRTTLTGPVVVKTAELYEVSLGATSWPRRQGTLMNGSLFDGTLGPRWLGVKRIRFDVEHKVVSWEK
jgi:predicted aspartyl protease